MKTLGVLAGLALVATVVPLSNATHDEGCVPTSMNPADVIYIDLTSAGGGLFYWEERNNPLGTSPPVPMNGFLLPGGGGTWLYEETNGIPEGQRGGIGLLGQCFPPPPFPCLILDEDPVNDENCGHGADRIIF